MIVAELPLLPLPKRLIGQRPKNSSGGSQVIQLTPVQQEQRIGPVFERLQSLIARPNAAVELRLDPASIAPERALVLEVAHNIADFNRLVSKTPGLEFLAEADIEFEPDEDFALRDTRRGHEGSPRTDKSIGGQVYVAMPDLAALRELLSLWTRWQNGRPLGSGFTQWRDIFAYLKGIRAWGPQDRIPKETVRYWEEVLQHDDKSRFVRTEVELWFFRSQARRRGAFDNFRQVLAECGGVIVDQSTILEIGYHGLLVDLPAVEVRLLAANEAVRLAVCDEVMFFRPQSMLQYPGDADVESSEIPDLPMPISAPPFAAMLDGVPLQRHALLEGRLIVDDPDDLEARSLVVGRFHGTAMASLILHGDRNLPEVPLSRPLYVRPVLYAPASGGEERSVDDRLLIDVIYRAVKRIKEGDEEGGPSSPEVVLIKFSLGDRNRPFSGPISPLGRLLDYLSERFNVLFLVSAGNILESLQVSNFQTWTDFENASGEDRKTAIAKALDTHKSERTLLSPAEALNVITVGAWHEDAVLNPPPSVTALAPFPIGEMPNISSALGLGHRRVIKPEVYLPGGRERVTFESTGGGLALRVSPAGRIYGLKVAAPGAVGDLHSETLTCGTSAATALATRAGHQILDALMDEAGGSLHSDTPPEYLPVIVKALLVHRARWGAQAAFLGQLYGPHGQGKHVARKDNIARVLGYGRAAVDEACACASHRATLVGYGAMEPDQDAHLYRIPLPTSLDRVKEPRALTVTLAWFSPVNVLRQMYRRVKLDFRPSTKLNESFGVARVADHPSDKSVARGTVRHERYTGNQAVAFLDDGHISINIWRQEQGDPIDQQVRYGLAVTIEAGEAVPIYQEIRTRLAIRPMIEV